MQSLKQRLSDMLDLAAAEGNLSKGDLQWGRKEYARLEAEEGAN